MSETPQAVRSSQAHLRRLRASLFGEDMPRGVARAELTNKDCAWPAEQPGGTPRSSGAWDSVSTPKPAINVAGSPSTVTDPNSPSASGSSSSAQRLDDLGTVAIQLGEQRRPLPEETPLPTQIPLSSLLAGPVNTAPPPQPDVTLESILGFDEVLSLSPRLHLTRLLSLTSGNAAPMGCRLSRPAHLAAPDQPLRRPIRPSSRPDPHSCPLTNLDSPHAPLANSQHHIGQRTRRPPSSR